MEFIHNHQNRTQVAQELTSLPWCDQRGKVKLWRRGRVCTVVNRRPAL
jgi:hypothetical protein